MNINDSSMLLAFVRKVVLSNTDFCLREEALDLLLKATSTDKVITISGLTTKITQGVAKEIEYLLCLGKKIHAIKMLRAVTGWGLRDSKDTVESSQFVSTPCPKDYVFANYKALFGDDAPPSTEPNVW